MIAEGQRGEGEGQAAELLLTTALENNPHVHLHVPT